MKDETLDGMHSHVIYLVMLNGCPTAWAGTRDAAERIATVLRLKENERNAKALKYDPGFRDTVVYTVMGVTDSPYGDPLMDTEERAGTRLLKTLNELEKIVQKLRPIYGTHTVIKDLEALL